MTRKSSENDPKMGPKSDMFRVGPSVSFRARFRDASGRVFLRFPSRREKGVIAGTVGNMSIFGCFQRVDLRVFVSGELRKSHKNETKNDSKSRRNRLKNRLRNRGGKAIRKRSDDPIDTPSSFSITQPVVFIHIAVVLFRRSLASPRLASPRSLTVTVQSRATS